MDPNEVSDEIRRVICKELSEVEQAIKRDESEQALIKLVEAVRKLKRIADGGAETAD